MQMCHYFITCISFHITFFVEHKKIYLESLHLWLDHGGLWNKQELTSFEITDVKLGWKFLHVRMNIRVSKSWHLLNILCYVT